jgi:hypothetical protein
MPDQDDGANLVQEVIADNPLEEKGVRGEWKKQVGWHRKEYIRQRRIHRHHTPSHGAGNHHQAEQHKKRSRSRQQRLLPPHRETRSSPVPDRRQVKIQEPHYDQVPDPNSVSRNHHKAHAINEEIRNDLLLAMVALLLFAGGAMALIKRIRKSVTKVRRSQ